ncbi:ABC transporter ATP-binding protein [Microbacterium lacticum]|uniref:ABC transporter ATP-binding protein n=1 Tax=Microbacterium TaxID=33882 RepID=UPI0018B0C694|nr:MULTISPECIES: ABC transporter ATP-binding protein [Microbacterium]MBF9336000.1 ABC transporter ATP-binding protein [Microbacterium lacticum]MCC9053897.1 ABC transporter ATP-binding protein [Microbacterium sp. F2E]
MTSSTLVDCALVSKAYGATTVLDDVSLRVRAGESIGLVGRNGAGKTTLLSIIQGLRRPSNGKVTLFGGPPTKARFRTELGVAPQALSLPDTARVDEVITYVRAHYHAPAPAGELIRDFDLGALARKQVGGLSGGQKRLVGACLAFAGNPRLVLLDEPTTGLDSEARERLWQIIRAKTSSGTSVITTSHYMEDIEQLSERIVVLHQGRIVSDGSVNDIRENSRAVTITVQADMPEDLSWLESGVVQNSRKGSFEIETTNVDRTLGELRRRFGTLDRVEVNRDSLENIIRNLTETR